MNKSITSIGIDLSLCGTGVVLLKDGKILEQKLIKSKPVGDKPINELKRIQKIVEEINILVEKYDPNIAVIENLAFGVRNATALTQLSGLNYFTRALLAGKEIPFILVAPTSLKKFITLSGASKKDVILMEVYKRWGVTILDDNCADAYGLSQIGLTLMEANSKSIVKVQQEVINLLKKQLI